MAQITCPSCKSTFMLPGGAGRRCVWCNADLTGTEVPEPPSFPSAPEAAATEPSRPAEPRPSAPTQRIIVTTWRPPIFGSTLAAADAASAPSPAAEPPPPPPRRDPVSASCPICGQLAKFETAGAMVRCERCGCDLVEPDRAGVVARVAVAARGEPEPPAEIPCPQCGGILSVPADVPGPQVRCVPCQRALTTPDLPLDRWVDLKSTLQAGAQAEHLVFLLRSRWTLGAISAGYVGRLSAMMSRVVTWLRQPPAERACDLPLPISTATDLLRQFTFAPDEARTESESAERVVLSISPKGPVALPPVLLTLAPGGDGSQFAMADDGASMAEMARDSIRSRIASSAPRALFRFLAYRLVFGEWMRPQTMTLVPRTILERELRRLGAADERFTALLGRMGGAR